MKISVTKACLTKAMESLKKIKNYKKALVNFMWFKPTKTCYEKNLKGFKRVRKVFEHILWGKLQTINVIKTQ